MTQRTCRVRATWRSFLPTVSAVLPPMPTSTSSKISTGTASVAASTTLSASIVRESSPPEAMRASGRTSSPELPENRNSAWSTPFGPEPPRLRADREISRGRPARAPAAPGTRRSRGPAPASSASTEVSSRPTACVAPLGEVGGARRQLGAQPLGRARSDGPRPRRRARGASRSVSSRARSAEDRLHALAVLPLEPTRSRPRAARWPRAAAGRTPPRRGSSGGPARSRRGAQSAVSSAWSVGWTAGSIRSKVAEQARRPARPLDGRRGIVVELPVRAGRPFGETLGVHEARDAPRAAPPPRPPGAARHRSPPWTPRYWALRVAWSRDEARIASSSAEMPRHSSWRWRRRSRRIPRPAKASRRSRWRAGRKQRLVLVLAVDLDQRLAELLEEGERWCWRRSRNTRPRPPRTSSRRTTSWPFSSVMP